MWCRTTASLCRLLRRLQGALVGCAFAVFIPDAGAAVFAATVAGGAASTLVSAALGRVITSVPQFTLAFNAIALSTLAYTKPFAAAQVSSILHCGPATTTTRTLDPPVGAWSRSWPDIAWL